MLQTLHNKRAFTTESIGFNTLVVHYFGFENCEPDHLWAGTRDHFLVHYVISGKGVFKSGDKTYHLGKGTFFLARPHQQVTFHADRDDPWEYCWVGFNGSEIPYVLSNTDFAFNEDFILIPPAQYDQVLDIFNTMFENRGNTLECRLRILSTLYQLFALLIEQSQVRQDDNLSHENTLLQATDYINQHLSDGDLSIDSIAKYLGISQSSLYRLFSNGIGTSPMKYIIEQRMKRSCELIRTTSLSITEISYRVGFNNSLYFSKYFKKYFKISPRAFKKEYANVKHPLEVDAFRPTVTD